MDTMLITGAGGLVGSAATEYFHAQGYRLLGVDNDLRGQLLHDPQGSTQWNIDRLTRRLPEFTNHPLDVRDKEGLTPIFREAGPRLKAIIHCAAQTAHEGEVLEDFAINTLGTLNLLDLWYRYCPEAVFIYLSTIKVYGNYPNILEYYRNEHRYDLPPEHRYYRGFDESVSIDQGISSFFGRSKTAADLYVQEYAYQFHLRAACFRASCLTGGLHAGTEAHGMLSYLMRCAYTRTPYRIYGYKGRQVRDQLHAEDMVRAIAEVIEDPGKNLVYNIGGGRGNACSIREAIEECQRLTGNKMTVSHHPMRIGDHRWWVTDNSRLEQDYPAWRVTYSVARILSDIYQEGKQRW
jgi:CDP-paratose 2-epimerase